ncbi:hypothetical protein M0R45_000493 [Rubus argutus]|uniref:Uncharacterized protein n=1 Tax=Rubus argutus TaxID=59490 RepID=A0AAW1VP79_RUBAR
MAGTTSGWRGAWAWLRSLSWRPSGAVSEGDWRVVLTGALPLPAAYGLDGATELAWMGVKEGWIDGLGCGLMYLWIGVANHGQSDT